MAIVHKLNPCSLCPYSLFPGSLPCRRLPRRAQRLTHRPARRLARDRNDADGHAPITLPPSPRDLTELSLETRTLLDPIDIHLPDLPSEIEGLRIGHVTDLHADVRRRHHRAIIDALGTSEVDMIVLTGDYMTRRGREKNPTRLVRDLCRSVAPPHGIYGVYGNHDSTALGDALG